MGLAPFLPEKPKIVKVCLPDFSESNLRYLQQIANEPRLQISLIVSVQNLTSKNYRYCKRITNEPYVAIAAMKTKISIGKIREILK